MIIIPCRPQIYDLETVPNSRELIALAGHTPVLVVLNAVPARGARADQTRQALTDFGLPVCSPTLGHRAAFGDSGVRGLAALEHEPSSKAAEEIRQVYKYISSFLAKQRNGEAENEQSRLVSSTRLTRAAAPAAKPVPGPYKLQSARPAGTQLRSRAGQGPNPLPFTIPKRFATSSRFWLWSRGLRFRR